MKTNIHFWSYLAQFFLEWEIFQTKVLEKIKTHILCLVIFFLQKSYRLWDNVGGKNIVELDRSKMTIWRMRIARWILKATDPHSEYVILIPLPQQQWLYEHTLVLLYKYVAWLVRCFTLGQEAVQNVSMSVPGTSNFTKSVMKGSSLKVVCQANPFLLCSPKIFIIILT